MFGPEVEDDSSSESSSDSNSDSSDSSKKKKKLPELGQLTKEDIEDFNLQEKLTKLNNPIYFVSFPNPHASTDPHEPTDHFGILKLWDEYMQFVPLDPTRRGVYDYVFSKNLAKNKHVEFKLNYADINDEEPVVMPVPSEEIDSDDKLDDFPINFNAQFNIFRTGYYGLARKEDQHLIDSFKAESQGIAEVTLKIPNYDLLDRKRNNEAREEYVNSLYSNVM